MCKTFSQLGQSVGWDPRARIQFGRANFRLLNLSLHASGAQKGDVPNRGIQLTTFGAKRDVTNEGIQLTSAGPKT